MKRVLALVLTAVLVLGCFAGCKSDEKVVRYLNFKPEIAKVYDEIAVAYKEATGVTLITETAASGSYEQTLTARMSGKEAPTIFQINGPIGYNSWKDYCADLSGTEFYKHLSDKGLAITSGSGVYGVPNAVEGYGIIFNESVMKKYFALENKATTFTKSSDINNFEKLKAVVEDMQKNKDALGIKGVFAATSLKSGEDWRWQTHLANVPIYYEFKNGNVDLSSSAVEKIKFTYGENFKNIFDLYLNNSTTDRKLLGTVNVDSSMAEFALGECAMVQNGNWGASQILGVAGNVVKNEDIKFMPIYTGVAGEEKQGLCIGTENFLCINSKASEEDQKLAADFLNWLYTSDAGKKFVTEKLGFIAPFDTFTSKDVPTDPLAQDMNAWMAKGDVTSVSWNFTLFPSQTFKDDFGSNLLKYAQGTMNWNDVADSVVKSWAKEYELQG